MGNQFKADQNKVQEYSGRISEMEKAVEAQKALLPQYLELDENGFSQRSKEIIRNKALLYASINNQIDIKNPALVQQIWDGNTQAMMADIQAYQKAYQDREAKISSFEGMLESFDDTILDELKTDKDFLNKTNANDPRMVQLHSIINELNDITSGSNDYNMNTIANQPGIAKLQKIRQKLDQLSVEAFDGDITLDDVFQTPDKAYTTMMNMYDESINGNGEFDPVQATFLKLMTQESHSISRFVNKNSQRLS